jgi:hypothetical protein
MTLPAAAACRPFTKDLPAGAATQVYVATAPAIVSGEYYANCNTHSSHPDAHDRRMAGKLWEASEAMAAGDINW